MHVQYVCVYGYMDFQRRTISPNVSDNVTSTDRKPHLLALINVEFFCIVLYKIGRASCRERV